MINLFKKKLVPLIITKRNNNARITVNHHGVILTCEDTNQMRFEGFVDPSRFTPTPPEEYPKKVTKKKERV